MYYLSHFQACITYRSIKFFKANFNLLKRIKVGIKKKWKYLLLGGKISTPFTDKFEVGCNRKFTAKGFLDITNRQKDACTYLFLKPINAGVFCCCLFVYTCRKLKIYT